MQNFYLNILEGSIKTYTPNFIQIFINIVTIGYGPNIHMELCYTSLQEFI
jgi:hypothetical protein